MPGHGGQDGPEPPVKTASLNGVPYQVGRNLWDFLRQKRTQQARDGPRLLWIDALCI